MEAPSGHGDRVANDAQVTLERRFAAARLELTQRIVETLSLPAHDARASFAEGATFRPSAKAYEYYLRATQFSERIVERGRLARDLYRQCLEEDPR